MESKPSLKLVRLSNGDDIVGFMEEYSNEELAEIDEKDKIYNYDHLLFIRDPMRMIWSYNTKTESHDLFLTRWMPFTDDNLFAIPKDKIVSIATPMVAVEEHYYEISDKKIPTKLLDERPNMSYEEKAELEQKRHYMEFLKNWDVDRDKKKSH